MSLITARLLALARDGACSHHQADVGNRWVDRPKHAGGFDACPHPDCALVRAGVPVPPEPPLIRYNCDCLPAGPDGAPSEADGAVYCPRWVYLAEEVDRLLAGVSVPQLAGLPMTTEPLDVYMNTDSPILRDAAFLRTYAARIRNGTAATWEIPSTAAGTLEGIASRLEAQPRLPRRDE